MPTTRTILVSAALGLAVLGAAAPAQASVAPTTPDAATDLATSHDDDVAAKKCRWVRGKGLICNTNGPFGTIGL